MKHTKQILILSIASLVAGSAFSEVPSPKKIGEAVADTSVAVKDKVERIARNLWSKSKGYLSEDERTYKDGARQALVDIHRDIDAVIERAGPEQPLYFRTRLLALTQQHEQLTGLLNDLSGEPVKDRLSGPRYAFDQGINCLQAAIFQADDETEVLLRVNSVVRAAK